MTVGSVTSQAGPFSDLRSFRPTLRFGGEAVTQKSDNKTGGFAPKLIIKELWRASRNQPFVQARCRW
jgi:hypothetical protein